MSHDSDLLDVAREIERATVERVVLMLENRWPIGEIEVPLHHHSDLQRRLRVLRGRIHGCSEHDYTGRWNAPQAEAPQESPRRVSNVQAAQAPAKTRRPRTTPRAVLSRSRVVAPASDDNRAIAERLACAERAILAAADALRDNDPNEAYYQLYGYVDPTFTETGDPFEKLREVWGASAPVQAPEPSQAAPSPLWLRKMLDELPALAAWIRAEHGPIGWEYTVTTWGERLRKYLTAAAPAAPAERPEPLFEFHGRIYNRPIGRGICLGENLDALEDAFPEGDFEADIVVRAVLPSSETPA